MSNVINDKFFSIIERKGSDNLSRQVSSFLRSKIPTINPKITEIEAWVVKVANVIGLTITGKLNGETKTVNTKWTEMSLLMTPTPITELIFDIANELFKDPKAVVSIKEESPKVKDDTELRFSMMELD